VRQAGLRRRRQRHFARPGGHVHRAVGQHQDLAAAALALGVGKRRLDLLDRIGRLDLDP